MPVPVFCCFLFQKSCSTNILGIARNKDQSPYFSNTYTEFEGETKGAPRCPHPLLAWVGPRARRQGVWSPRASTDAAPSPIYCPRRENPKISSHIPRIVLQRRRHRRQVSGDISLCFGTPPGRGIAPGVISIDTTAIFIAATDSHDEEGVVLPRG